MGSLGRPAFSLDPEHLHTVNTQSPGSQHSRGACRPNVQTTSSTGKVFPPHENLKAKHTLAVTLTRALPSPHASHLDRGSLQRTCPHSPVSCVCVLPISEMSTDSAGFTSKGTPGVTPSEGFNAGLALGDISWRVLFTLPSPPYPCFPFRASSRVSLSC